jgi:hypothetical protein
MEVRWTFHQKLGFERMSDILTPLTIDFLAWLNAAPRSYAEVMDVWRTSCPRLTIWEDALDAGLVMHVRRPGEPAMVGVTEKGFKMLAARHASGA